MSPDTSIENDDTGESTGDELAALKARVRDLEADVYGFSNDEPSAGQEVALDVKRTIVFLNNRQGGEDAVSLEAVWGVTEVLGLPRDVAEQGYDRLKRHGEVYEPATGEVRTT